MLAPHKQQTERETPSLTIIGIGNDYRMDDAAGLLVARKVRKQLPIEAIEGGVEVLESTGGSFELMDLWTEASHVVLVDAVSSGADPGTIFRLDAHNGPLPSALFHYSTHGFNLADTIELARLLNKLPARLVVFGIEGLDFGQGEGLSEDMEAAIERVVLSLLEYVDYNLKADEKQSRKGARPCMRQA